MRRELRQRRALVTGASSGIGYALALELARGGANVLATARRADRLQALQAQAADEGLAIDVLPADLTDPLARQALIDSVVSRWGGLDVLVNNAGAGAIGRFDQATPERMRRVMEVNFFALVELTRLALPLLKAGREPILVNLSSILGHRGVPYNSEYCASKFAVQGFSEVLRTELAADGIDVLVVCPGTTETEFFTSAEQGVGKPAWPVHRPVSAAAVARSIVKAMRAGRREIVPYFWGKVLVWLNRLSPALTDRVMRRYV